MLKKWGVFIAAMALMAACAEIKVSPYKGQVEGIRFYRPAPYLLVTVDPKGVYQVSLIYLPKINEEYIIQVTSGLGSADMKFKLDGGWNLTDFGESRDSKIPELVTSLSTAFMGALKSEQNAPAKPAPGLYALTFDDKTGLVSGIKLVEAFQQPQ